MYLQTLEVHGKGRFPVELLTVDFCYPETVADGEVLAASFKDKTNAHYALTLARHVRSEYTTVREEYWERTKWEVMKITTRRLSR